MNLSEPIILLIVANLSISIVIQVFTLLLLREFFRYVRASHGAIHARLDYLVGKVDLLDAVAHKQEERWTPKSPS